MKKYNFIKETPDGTVLYNQNDTYVGRSVELYGQYQAEELKLFERYVQKGDSVLDIGANIGTHTLWFANKVGDTGWVGAFEPQRLVFQTLCANMALNSIQNVDCRQLGVGSMRRLVKVPPLNPLVENNFGGLSIQDHTEGEDVAICPIDDMGLVRCDFIKIDVEGMEPEVLQGGMNTIVKTRPIIYLELDREENIKFVEMILQELKYTAERHNPPLYSPDYDGENVFVDETGKEFASLNVIAIPQEKIN
tara:strand:- start:532 stop:1278 length:747 start_codon:yes stop_codon:yes gene_type:complete